MGRPKVRRADKSAEPIGQPNPSPAKSGGPTLPVHTTLQLGGWAMSFSPVPPNLGRMLGPSFFFRCEILFFSTYLIF